jgi:KDO2-lipid IV(A) lauroyltransferase
MSKSKSTVYAEYFAFIFIVKSIQLMPKKIQYLIIDTLMLIASNLIKSARKVVEINLNIAFKLAPREREKIMKSFFFELGRTALELVALRKKDIPSLVQKMKVTNFEIIPKLLEKKKGLIICTPHYGSWEMISHYLCFKKIPIHVVYRPLDNPLLEKYFKDIRISTGTHLIPRKLAIKAGSEALLKNEIFGLIYDQNASHGGIFVPFFGTKASTMRGPSFYAMKHGSPVICTYAHRNQEGGHDVFFSEELMMGQDDIENLKTINAYFEPVIQKNPQHYFWVHPRWKKRPPGEKSFYEGLPV